MIAKTMTPEQALEWLEGLRNTPGDQVCAEIEDGKAAEAAQVFRDTLEAAWDDVAEWKARADKLAAALRNCLKLAYNCDRDELPNAIITTASKAVAKYDMLAAFSAVMDD